MGKYYVTNKQLIPAIRKCKEIDDMTPEFTEMVIKLVNAYSTTRRFHVADAYREEMKATALVAVVQGWRMIDPDHPNTNPFAYLTQTIKNAFYQYQNHEWKQKKAADNLMIRNGLPPSDSYMVNYEDEQRANSEFYDSFKEPD